jgi:hypothetical protein
MNPLTRQQVEHNANSRDSWDVFRPHRARVTELLIGVMKHGHGRLCVLGAGNCNDLDLGLLLEAYREVHLVDLDTEALAGGVRRQAARGSPTVHTHGGVDVTGMLETLAGWSPATSVRDEDLSAIVQGPVRSLAAVLPGPFETVASTCLLSQLIGSVVQTLGEAHPRFVQSIQAVRTGHLRLLAHLVAPGGSGLLISDLVSSETFPSLGTVPDESLSSVLAQLIHQGNFFHGVNPAVVTSFFRSDPEVAPQVAELELVWPWLWDLGPRLYAVYALKFRKKAHGPSFAG